MQIFLQYCYSTILTLELYCSSILKKIIIFYSLFPPKFLSPLSHYFSSLLSLPSLFLHLLSPLFRPKHHSPPNINITHHSGSFFLVGYDPAGSVVAFFFFWAWVTAWVSGGCGFWRGPLWWLWFFFFVFFGCDRCLKRL